MNIHADDLEGCVDCLLYVAIGDVPEGREELPAVIAARWPAPLAVVSACPDDCEGYFSWHPCKICGSQLEGDRHPFAVLCEHIECA